MDEPGQQVEPGVALPDPLPQVRGPVAVGVGRVPGAAPIAEVEGQEPRGLTGQAGGHRHPLRIHREMHESPARQGENVGDRGRCGTA